MDSRDWMSDPTKKTEEYIRGVNEFVEFAFRNVEADRKIFCPCKKCANTHLHSRTSVYLHLTDPHRGFLRGYRQWIFHGERPTIPLNRSFEEPREMGHDMEGLLEDAFAMHPMEEETHDNNEERQKIIGINKQNCAKLEDTDCMSTKSLPVVIDEKDEIKKHVPKGETSQASQSKQGSTFWKDDLLSKVQGPENEKRRRVRCLGKIPPVKKSKTSSSTNADLREEVIQIKGLLTNMLKLMQSRLPVEDVQNILQLAAEQVPDASSKSNDQSNSGSQSS